MRLPRDFLIVALDYPDLKSALSLVDILGDTVSFYKVGMQLFYTAGLSALQELKARQKKIFLDLKINDIPATVSLAVKALEKSQPDYLTLFTAEPQIREVARVLEKDSHMKILNVTVLTSDMATQAQVLQRAELTRSAGAHGVICSGHETGLVKERCGPDFIIVNPGIRPAGYAKQDDQTRVVTPRMAYDAGATNIVVGRPITGATDPVAAVEGILGA